MISAAHEWAQQLPLINKSLICLRCQIETRIGAFNIERCTLHGESDNAGWLADD